MMNRMRRIMASLAVLLFAITMQAQTDCTSYVTNPSFESEFNGWIHKSMNIQNNSVFSIKAGTNYVEKWTGRGGAVGNGLLSQSLKDLPPGNYELSAAAQNIQEDTPTTAQTGAWIFAGDNKTTVTIRGTYKVSFTYISGKVDIGFEAVGASGNWLAVDNFRLTLVNSDLSQPLNDAIARATTLYGDGSGKKAQQLKDAIDHAKSIAAQPDATGRQQADAIIALQQAESIFQLANATSENPLDMTSHITNPSFETGDLTGWTASGLSTMDNNIFSIKQGKWYLEKWTWRGNTVGDARLSQKLTDMPAGRYRLTAAAQNIQEDTPNAQQNGAWIFAGQHSTKVMVRDNYTLEFVQVADVVEIGFNAKNATGNWLSVDNFRLEFIGESSDEVKSEFENMIARAQALLIHRMNNTVKQTLTDAIAAALAADLADSNFSAIATALETAYNDASSSQAVFARLAAAIASAREEIEGSEGSGRMDYQNAIDTAQDIYDNNATTDAQAEAAITALAEASFAFKVQNGAESGTPPTVTTDTRFIRGCEWAFGRSTVKGANIIEEGFCWSEQPDPKVTDKRTQEYLNQAGKIYWLRDLKPATVYYMRAYAINKDYAVGYGDVIKFVTLPKGRVGHWYNNGGDEATNDRINYAINTAMDYYWNNLTSIHGFGISVTYSPGTPTADCSYGGSMRVGSSSSYQQPGTIMHEALHGIGVGTHGNWWSGDYRVNGVWVGDRVTEALRFWDNNTDGVLSGDDMHMWPYGCNGAHEDTHSDNLYCMMGILAQALNEDGLPGSGDIGYALPYYAFNHDNGVKYYIKNEDEKRGLRSAYLVETASHTLQWQTMTAEEAAGNDAAAWYVSFTPSSQYYQLRNAASGYYMTYASGFKTANHSTPTTADNLHLMRGRVNVDGHRGYYIIHPESSSNPPTLIANTNGNTGTAQWSVANSATTQRWLILTADEALNFDNGNIELARAELADMLAHIRKLAETPHSENVQGADATLTSTLNTLQSQAESCTKGVEVQALTQQAWAAAVTFLSSVSATDLEQPFDLTFMIENPDFDSDATTGWNSTNGAPGYDAQGAEFYEKIFNYYQVLDNMPSGNYELCAYAFQRPGAYDAIFTAYKNGTAKVTTSLYINSTTAAVKHICDDRQPNALYNDGGWGSDKQMGDGTYIPNCMIGAEKYFAKGLYDNSVLANLDTKGASLRVGIKCTSAPGFYWMMFDHFRLHFFGTNDTLLGIKDLKDFKHPNQSTDETIYDLRGRKVIGKPAPGIYIIGGKKVVR